MRWLLLSVVLLAAAVEETVVKVVAHGPAGLRIEGTSAEVSVDAEASALIFKAPVAAIDTGIDLRNRHLRASLEAERFPDVTLRVIRADLKFPAEAAPSEGSVKAELTLHGQTRPVVVRYEARSAGPGVRAKGSFHFDLRDFGVTPPSYLGVAVSPDVAIEVELPVPR